MDNENKRVRIHYSTSFEVKKYLEFLADKYQLPLSSVLTMIVVQYKNQDDTLSKLSIFENTDFLKSFEKR